MGTLTEIIPDDMPEWALDAMAEGQFFREACKWQERFIMLASQHWVEGEYAMITENPYTCLDEYIESITEFIDEKIKEDE